MPHFDQLEIVDPNGQIQFVDLDPSLGVLNIGAHPDNDLIVVGASIRPFHALLDFRARPYQVIPVSDEGESTGPVELTQWQSFHLGGYELILAPVGTPASGPAAAGTATPG